MPLSVGSGFTPEFRGIATASGHMAWLVACTDLYDLSG